VSDSSAREPKLRMFYALVPDAPTRECIAAAAAVLPVESYAQLVPRSNYHMTLAFVGEVPASQLQFLKDVGGAQRAPMLALDFDAYEFWPKPEVIVAAARTIPTSVSHLWRELHGALAIHGWALDPKRLRPHVTLARKVGREPVLAPLVPFEWRAREFCLVRSESDGTQPIYTVVDTWPLLDNP
jgi:2'-5' RNA ligase